jgi:GTP cyclohydrolase I
MLLSSKAILGIPFKINFVIEKLYCNIALFMDTLKEHFSVIVNSIGLEHFHEGLKKTPQRAAEGFSALTQGYRQDIDVLLNQAFFECTNQELVLVKNIEFYSLCEHHLMPFFGKCHVGYLPSDKVIGLSKIARVVDHFSRRLQIQEGLTQQIAELLAEKLQAKAVGVVMEASHLCMMMRGVCKQNATLQTRFFTGLFKQNTAERRDFLSSI